MSATRERYFDNRSRPQSQANGAGETPAILRLLAQLAEVFV
jgi:hypothetical protein